ncbi:serine hydrolase [Novispirillum sp. DQ9]|uniref:serine hydrolase n=1 Tax=Novispirillum sp. DQ9 TaxID=3398612 RepID=UPI003C7EAD3F
MCALAAIFSLVSLIAAASPALARYASIVIDVDSGRVLYARNPDVRNHPASLTKMMTLYMLFEAMEKGKANLKTRLPASARAAGQPPTKLGLKPGDTIAVEDAIKALVTRSANDVAVVVAEFIGGTEPAFAQMMTKRAQQLGMANTTFRNASGLPDKAQLSTARDMATLSIALRRDHPQYYHFFGISAFEWGGRTIRTHNHVLRQYDGADGLKTGYVNASGFNLATSAQRNGRRLVGVVFGGKTAGWRDRHMMTLLDDSFQQVTVMASLPPPGRKPDPLLASIADNATDALPPDDPADINAAVPPAKPAPVQQAALAPAPGAVPAKPAPATTASPPPASPTAVAPLTPLLTPPQATTQVPRSWGVQVGAYTAFTSASEQAAKAARMLQATAPESNAAVTPLQAEGGLIYRARVLGLPSEADARAACSKLRSLETRCVVVPPGDVDVALIRLNTGTATR